jgi:hypothetical protein
VMGRVLLQEREPTEEEEAIFRAAEHMTDRDLLEMTEFVEKRLAELESSEPPGSRKKPEVKRSRNGGLEYHCGDTDESLEGGGTVHGAGPMNLALDWGRWAGHAEWLGLARQDATAEVFTDSGSDYHIGGGHTRRTSWYLTVEPAGIELARLVRRCACPDKEDGSL